MFSQLKVQFNRTINLYKIVFNNNRVYSKKNKNDSPKHICILSDDDIETVSNKNTTERTNEQQVNFDFTEIGNPNIDFWCKSVFDMIFIIYQIEILFIA